MDQNRQVSPIRLGDLNICLKNLNYMKQIRYKNVSKSRIMVPYVLKYKCHGVFNKVYSACDSL